MKYYKILFITNLVLFLIISGFSNAQGISELRENSNQGIPILENSVKTVSGVNASKEFRSNSSGYIQDNKAGVFFSEYIEGSSNNKSLEIYNGAGADIDLANYRVILAANGAATPGTTLPLSGTLVPGDVYVISNASAVADVQAVTDITSSVTYFNGNDYVGLQFNNVGDWETIDGIGVLGSNPGNAWDVAGTALATLNHTIVRKSSVTTGNSDWATSAGTTVDDSEWEVYTQDTFNYLGSHNENLINFSADNTLGSPPLTVNFTDLSLNNPNSWLWNFGDGNTSTSQNPQHTYTAIGVYTVSLTVGYGTITNTKVKTDYIKVIEERLSTTSENFIFYYTKTQLCTDDLIVILEKKFDNLDKIIFALVSNINLLDRSQKVKVFLYDTDETFLSPPVDLRDWDVGYYLLEQNEIHIKVPSNERQLKYFPTFEKAAISILARYIMEKKRTNGIASSKGLSFGFGLYESGYSLDLNAMRNYLNLNNNAFPNKSTFSTWSQLDDELNVELAYSHVFATILRRGYFSSTIHDGFYEDDKDIWYQMIRIYFLIDIEEGGMRKYVEEDDFIIYANSQEEADLVLEGLRWYADVCEETFDTRINHPILITIFGSAETYMYTKNGNIDVLGTGGEALSHNLLRSTTYVENLNTELNKISAKHNDTMEHEFTHNIIAFLMETMVPSWLNEGAAMNIPERRVYGYIGFNVQFFAQHHNYWNDKGMLFPGLNDAFTIGAPDPGFGYHMSYSAFTFLKDHVSKEALREFIKRSDDFSIIGYSDVDEFQRHLYETLYHQYMSSFLFNPNWDLERTYAPGTNYVFNWDGHYIENLIIEYSVDETKSWNPIKEVALSSGSHSWSIPDAENCILRFSDKKFPEINFSYQILGEKPKFGKVFLMDFENGEVNSIPNHNNGRLKGNVSFASRGGANGSYAKFDGLWDVINVFNYPELSLNEEWTIQGDFMIENTTGLTNQKPVLVEKMATLQDNINYAISFNRYGQNHLFFEYQLENNTTVSLEIDDANITNGNWYTFYFAHSVENNIVEARVYNQMGNLLGSDIRQINGEGKLLTGAGDLYLSSGDFRTYEQDLQGGLDNIIIADTYFDKLMSNSMNNAPIVSNIDNQTVNEGESFGTIRLDDFVSDTDNKANEMSWSYSGNVKLSIDIDINRIATISIPNSEWYGSETITFIATDPDGASDSDEVIFTVININDGPVISDIPNQTINEGSSFTTIPLDNFVSDIDNVDSQIIWSYSGNSLLLITISDNRVATITTPNQEWNGSETITFKATDPEGASDSDEVIFTVTNVNDGPIISDIPNQTIDEGSSFEKIPLDNFVTDIDNLDSQITWSFNGSDELSIELDSNRIATVLIPDKDWSGSETITFTAKDPSDVSSSKNVIFTVNAINDPPVISGAPELIEFVSDTSYTLNIWEFISDIETSVDSLICEFNVDSDSIMCAYNAGTGILTLSSALEFGGEGELIWSVCDSIETVKDSIHIIVEKAVIISIKDELIIPEDFVLHQNYPNPFNPSTMIKYGVPEQSSIRIEIFSMLGQSVGLLVNTEKSVGYYETIWDASNLPSGIYLISVSAIAIDSKKNFTQVKKALLLK